MALAVAALVTSGACTVVPAALVVPITIGPGTTSLSVDPSSFLGTTVVCSNRPGGMQSYVATVTDLPRRACARGADCPLSQTCLYAQQGQCSGAAEAPCDANGDCPQGQTCFGAVPGECDDTFVLPSSPPTSCGQISFFEYATAGDGFIAAIDGYEESSDQLVPLCSLPGPNVACQVDGDCAAAGHTVAFGCTGKCLVNTYENPITPDPNCILACNGDPTCVTDCGLRPDFSKPLRPCDTVAPPPDGGVETCTCHYTPVEGSRTMLSRITQEPVSPRWHTTCGRGPLCNADSDCTLGTICLRHLDASDGGATAGVGTCVPQGQSFFDVAVTPCDPLVDDAADGGGDATAIQVVPSAALSTSSCAVAGPDGGTATITRFDVTPSDASVPAQTGLPCPSGAGVTFSQGVVAGKSYAFKIQAYAGATLVDASSCFAVAVAGFSTTAMCDPLVPVP